MSSHSTQHWDSSLVAATGSDGLSLILSKNGPMSMVLTGCRVLGHSRPSQRQSESCAVCTMHNMTQCTEEVSYSSEVVLTRSDTRRRGLRNLLFAFELSFMFMIIDSYLVEDLLNFFQSLLSFPSLRDKTLLLETNQRPVSGSRDHSRTIRG